MIFNFVAKNSPNRAQTMSTLKEITNSLLIRVKILQRAPTTKCLQFVEHGKNLAHIFGPFQRCALHSCFRKRNTICTNVCAWPFKLQSQCIEKWRRRRMKELNKGIAYNVQMLIRVESQLHKQKCVRQSTEMNIPNRVYSNWKGTNLHNQPQYEEAIRNQQQKRNDV